MEKKAEKDSPCYVAQGFLHHLDLEPARRGLRHSQLAEIRYFKKVKQQKG